MKKHAMIFVLPFLLSLRLGAASFESANQSAQKMFLDMQGLRMAFVRGKVSPGPSVEGQVVTSAASVKSIRYIRVQGHIFLNGSGYAPSHLPYANVALSGSTELRDSSGQLRSGYRTINVSKSFYVAGGVVSDWVRFDADIPFYLDNQYVGTGRVSGAIYVSGTASNGWVHANGSGILSGDIAISEP